MDNSHEHFDELYCTRAVSQLGRNSNWQAVSFVSVAEGIVECRQLVRCTKWMCVLWASIFRKRRFNSHRYFPRRIISLLLFFNSYFHYLWLTLLSWPKLGHNRPHEHTHGKETWIAGRGDER